MRQLAQLYMEKGESAIREMLVRQVPDEVIEQLIIQLVQSRDSEPAQNTLPAESVLTLAGITVAVMTDMPEKRGEWREALQGHREVWSSQSDDLRNEAAFAAALLAILNGEKLVLPVDKPYSDVVKQINDMIESHQKDEQQ